MSDQQHPISSDTGDREVRVKTETDEASASSSTTSDVPEKVPESVEEKDEQSADDYPYPTPILYEELLDRFRCYHLVSKKEYNFGILALGVSHVLSYSAYFCRYEGQEHDVEVVSVGSDDGFVNKEIITDYYSHFMKKLEITPVSANPEADFEFKTVDDLVGKRPNIVGNCVLLLIWPDFVKTEHETTEIDVIRKLQPRAVLTIYEIRGLCGSDAFRAYLRDDKDYPGWARCPNGNHGLENYVKKEIGHQRVNYAAGEKRKVPGSEEEETLKPGTLAFEFKLVQLTREDCVQEYPAVSSPETDDGSDDDVPTEA